MSKISKKLAEEIANNFNTILVCHTMLDSTRPEVDKRYWMNEADTAILNLRMLGIDTSKTFAELRQESGLTLA